MTPARELGRFIREHAGALRAAWREEVRELPDVRGLSDLSPQDHVDELLASLAELVEAPPAEWPSEPAFLAAIDRHVLARQQVGAGLPLILADLADLAALRRVVERAWRAQTSDPARLAPTQHLCHAIDVALVASSRRFIELRLQLLETLDRLVAAAESRHLDDYLRRMLEVARRDIPSLEVAAVLVREGDRLRVCASLGLPRDDAGETVHMGQGFAGRIAAERHPLLVQDASHDLLTARASLRDAGVRALFGVPLLAPDEAGGAVIGVAHMGSRSREHLPAEAVIVFKIIAGRAAVLIHSALLRERLEEERARFRAIADNAPALIFLKDLQGRFEFMSRRAADMLGRPPASFPGRTVHDMFPAEIAAPMAHDDQLVVETRAVVESEHVVARVDGERRTYMTIKFPVMDAQGRPRGVGGIATDVTERKRREEEQALLARAGALLASSLEVDGVLTALVDLVVPARADLCIIDLVAELVDVAGVDARGRAHQQDAGGRVAAPDGGRPGAAAPRAGGPRSLRRLRVAHADPLRAPLARALLERQLDPARWPLTSPVLETGQATLVSAPSARELEVVAQDPEDLRLLTELAPRAMIQVPFRARGRLLGVAVLLACGPARRPYDRQDLRALEDLGRLASLALDNAHLYAAAQRAVRARDEVLAVVAHDLRNPLSVISTALGGALAAPPDADPAAGRKRLSMALAAARRAGRLTEDLLDVARIEAGRLSVRPTPQDPRRLLSAAADARRALALEVGAALRVDAPAALPRVLADEDRVLQVLGNLLSNALRHTPAGGQVTLGAEAEPAALRCWVDDTGQGMPAAERERAFERFWRGTRADRAGAGLGLPISRAIVEAHGGHIWIDSAPGRGTRVSFTLPLAPRLK